MPLNVPGVHWAMLLLDINSRRVYFCDSCPELTAETKLLAKKAYEAALTELFGRCLCLYGGDEASSGSFQIWSHGSTGVQKDGSSCGLFVIMYAVLLIKKIKDQEAEMESDAADVQNFLEIRIPCTENAQAEVRGIFDKMIDPNNKKTDFQLNFLVV